MGKPATPLKPKPVIQDTPPAPTTATLAEMQAMCDKKLYIDITFSGKTFRVEARRLTPEEDAQLDQLLNTVIPAVLKGRTQEEDRMDVTNLEFIRKKGIVEIEARSLALYWCVPMFAVEKPGLKDRGEITAFIQTKLNSALLSTLFNGIRNGGVTLAELVNFD